MLGKGLAMRTRVKMFTMALLTVFTFAGAVARDLPQELGSLVEGFQAHRRAAIGYLRTQNSDLGATEIERLQRRWAADRVKLPSATVADTALSAALARTEALVSESLTAVDGGGTERARTLLEKASEPLDAWRKLNGYRVFSDCIAEIGVVYERLDIYRVNRPDLSDSAIAAKVIKASKETIGALQRCDHEASSTMRIEPEFRRLFDGMQASLRQVPDAIRAKDGALLYRLLIEQRSFERLLSFRFG
jgi:hypothetical protein